VKPDDTRLAARALLLAALTGLLGAASIFVPYVDALLGLEVRVAMRVEVADHVIPGLVVAAGALASVLLLRGRAGIPRSVPLLVATAACFLGGLWMTSTHVPLLVEAGEGIAPWGGAILHSVLGPPIVVMSFWLFALELPAAQTRE